MATLTKQTPGAAITYQAADAGLSDQYLNDGHSLVHIQNAGGVTCNVTVNSVRPCDQGFDHDETFAITAGNDLLIGPFSQTRFNNASGYVQISYDQVASVTVAVIGS